MSGLYVDSSALIKRIFPEAQSDEVRRVLRERGARGEVVASSALAWVEVSRALVRDGVADIDVAMDEAFAGIAQQPLSPGVLSRAERIGPTGLRSLDAIHLAAALVLGTSDLLTFDHRLALAAEAAGLRLVPQPGSHGRTDRLSE